MIVGCQRKKDQRPTKKEQRPTQILAGTFQFITEWKSIIQTKLCPLSVPASRRRRTRGGALALGAVAAAVLPLRRGHGAAKIAELAERGGGQHGEAAHCGGSAETGGNNNTWMNRGAKE